MERGVVTSAIEVRINGCSVEVIGSITPEQIRYLSLYWDKVIVTDSSLFKVDVSGETQVLIDANILRKETAQTLLPDDLNINMTDVGKRHLESTSKVIASLSEQNSGQWTIHQSGGELYVPENMSKELVTADFELNRCLPVPMADYPLDKLIEFKHRRRDQLGALRESLDELYLDITRSRDIPRAKIVKITQLEKAIKELDSVAKESWGKRSWASRSVSLDINFGNIMQGVVTGGAIGSTFTNPVLGLFAATGLAIASSMKFEVRSSKQLASAVGNQLELSYLSSLKEENIVR